MRPIGSWVQDFHKRRWARHRVEIDVPPNCSPSGVTEQDLQHESGQKHRRWRGDEDVNKWERTLCSEIGKSKDAEKRTTYVAFVCCTSVRDENLESWIICVESPADTLHSYCCGAPTHLQQENAQTVTMPIGARDARTRHCTLCECVAHAANWSGMSNDMSP